MVKRSRAFLNTEKDPATNNLRLFSKESMSLLPYNPQRSQEKGAESIGSPAKYCQF